MKNMRPQMSQRRERKGDIDRKEEEEVEGRWNLRLMVLLLFYFIFCFILKKTHKKTSSFYSSFSLQVIYQSSHADLCSHLLSQTFPNLPETSLPASPYYYSSLTHLPCLLDTLFRNRSCKLPRIDPLWLVCINVLSCPAFAL